MPAKRESISFRTPLSRTQRAHVTRLHQEFKVKPDEKRFWEREYRTSTGIGATSPVERPGGRRKTRRSKRKSRKNRS